MAVLNLHHSILSSQSSASKPNLKTHTVSKTSTTSLSHGTNILPTIHASSSNSPKSLHLSYHTADSLASALQQCAATFSVREGAQIHARIIYLGLSSDLYLCSQLLYFYASCRCPDAARSVFDAVPESHLNLFFYNVMLRAYTDSARYDDVLHLFFNLVSSNFHPNRFSFPIVLKSCTQLGRLCNGREIHGMLVVTGFQSDVFAACALLDLYFKCNCLDDACKVFDRMCQRNVVAWNSLISALAENGLCERALEVMDMIADEVDVCSWNSLIAGCVRGGDGGLALEMFGLMLTSAAASVKPNSATFNTLLPVIPSVKPLSRLKEFHGFAIRQQRLLVAGSIDEERLLAAVTAGYAYNGCMVSASKLFEIVSFKTNQLWISMISGFIDCEQADEAFHVFRQMVTQHGWQLETFPKVSLTLLLSECDDPLSLTGLEIHAYACRIGLDSDTSVNNALIAMYARRSNIKRSEQLFTRMSNKDVVSWNTMVSSYARHQQFDHAFKLFHQMHHDGVKPDEFSFGSILRGCEHLAALKQGLGIHGYIIRSGFSVNNCVVQNALLDMYGKCGCIEEAEKVFDEMICKDIVSWNTMISCYGINTRPHKAYALFKQMQDRGWKPNRITFIALLSACSHAGLVSEGLHCFQSMSSEHGIVPDIEHYACVIDNLARAGQLDMAYQLIKSMPMEPDDCIWGALLSGCRIHGNVVLAEVAAKHLIELEPHHSGYRVLLSNVYADARRWNDVAQVRAAMKEEGIRKFPGCSWIDVGGELHSFYTADKSHKQWMRILLTLDGLTEQLKEEGYVPKTDSKLLSFDPMKVPELV